MKTNFDLFLGIWCVLFGIAVMTLAVVLLVQWIRSRRSRKQPRNLNFTIRRIK